MFFLFLWKLLTKFWFGDMKESDYDGDADDYKEGQKMVTVND